MMEHTRLTVGPDSDEIVIGNPDFLEAEHYMLNLLEWNNDKGDLHVLLKGQVSLSSGKFTSIAPFTSVEWDINDFEQDTMKSSDGTRFWIRNYLYSCLVSDPALLGVVEPGLPSPSDPWLKRHFEEFHPAILRTTATSILMTISSLTVPLEDALRKVVQYSDRYTVGVIVSNLAQPQQSDYGKSISVIDLRLALDKTVAIWASAYDDTGFLLWQPNLDPVL